jgi:2-methylisocitrate lyase-like PEP mutase family enzyme
VADKDKDWCRHYNVLGVATMNDMRDHAAMIAGIDPTIPLVADADTGYGGESSLPFCSA